MNPQQLLAASTRVALSGLTHDVGKFAERAGIDPGTELLESNLHQYARRQQAGGRQWLMLQPTSKADYARLNLEAAVDRFIGHVGALTTRRQ
jgi:hypothetical protein